MQTQKSEAEVVNEVLESSSPSIYRMLSERGRAIFFPSKGLIRQSQEAQGKKYNATLGLANEDDGTPMRLPSIAHWINMDPSLTFPYASSYGDTELRRTWRSMIFQKNPSLKAAISTPVVTCGITHGLSMAGYLFTRDRDEILITDLYWGNYRLIFENAYGARLRPLPTFEGKGFGLKGLESALEGQSEKIILLLNFPNNPTGYTLTDREAVSIVEILGQAADKGKDILVILDDSYFGLVYESGIYKESLFSKLAGLHERILTVKIDGATKEDYVWGFRIGFITYGSKARDEKE